MIRYRKRGSRVDVFENGRIQGEGKLNRLLSDSGETISTGPSTPCSKHQTSSSFALSLFWPSVFTHSDAVAAAARRSLILLLFRRLVIRGGARQRTSPPFT